MNGLMLVWAWNTLRDGIWGKIFWLVKNGVRCVLGEFFLSFGGVVVVGYGLGVCV